MEKKYQIFYQSMLKEIEKCWQTDKTEKEKAENSFWIAHHYCDSIKKIVRKEGFSGCEEEIHFFRNDKPQFYCFLDYYALLCEVLMFVPAKKELELDFWNEESMRFQRFCKKHHSFIAYYESGSTHLNGQYFLRKNIQTAHVTISQHDSEPEFSTYFDDLLGKYLAQKKLLQYIMQRKMQLDPKSGN